MAGLPPAGWFADPLTRFQYRYWDGFEWTEHVATQGCTYRDPVIRARRPAAESGSPLVGSTLTTDGLQRRWFGLSQRPRRPRRRRVRRPRVGSRPPATIWEMADRCIKCGRPLTDPRSRRARVGTKCIRIYGSQQRRIPNPSYDTWLQRKSQADATYTSMKAQAEADFTRAKEAYSVWQSRSTRRRQGRS